MIPKSKNEAIDQSLERWRDALCSNHRLARLGSKCSLCQYSYQSLCTLCNKNACMRKCSLAQSGNGCLEKGSVYLRIYNIILIEKIGSFFLNELKYHKKYNELKKLIQKMIEQLEGLRDD